VPVKRTQHVPEKEPKVLKYNRSVHGKPDLQNEGAGAKHQRNLRALLKEAPPGPYQRHETGKNAGERSG